MKQKFINWLLIFLCKYLRFQNNFQKRKHIHLLIRFGDQAEVFVPVWPKPTEKDYTRLILFQKYLMLIWRTQKHKHGWNLH